MLWLAMFCVVSKLSRRLEELGNGNASVNLYGRP